MFKKVNKISKLLLVSFLSLLLMINFIPNNNLASASTTTSDSSIAYGADIGWLTQLQDNGVTWVDENNNTADPLQLLVDNGIDSVRLRVFVNPPESSEWTKDDGTTCLLGYCDKDSVIDMAKEAKALGLKVMIDFHYSDHFADPAYQTIPEAWQSHTVSQLTQDVYDFTYDVMSSLADENIYPEWVQVGNEVNSGMLWPSGYIWGSNGIDVTNFSKFINAGYSAVKAVSSSSKVIIHLANGYDNSTFRTIFDALEDAGTNYDVIGMSYYPYWQGVDYTDSIDELETNLNDMASRYDKEVMIAEVGGLETDADETYDLIQAVIEKVEAVPDNKGIGVFYWEPEVSSSVLPDEYPLGTCTEVSTNVLQFTTAISAFKDYTSSTSTFPDTSATYKIINKYTGKALNVSGGSSTDGAAIEQYTYNGWDSQKWTISESSTGYYEITNVLSGKVLDITGSSTSDNAAAIQWTSKNGWNQQWKFVASGSYYKIQNRYSSKLLSVASSSSDECASIVQASDSSIDSQLWYFVKVD